MMGRSAKDADFRFISPCLLQKGFFFHLLNFFKCVLFYLHKILVGVIFFYLLVSLKFAFVINKHPEREF